MRRRSGASVGLLGILTIAVYGSWYYSFGVLLDPIVADTGWSETSVATAFGTSILLGGLGALFGGWLLDRFGSRFVFAAGAIVGAVAFTVAATAQSPVVFGVAAAVGGGVFGAVGFYHVTQTVAVRLEPVRATRAIATLTIWGAFASVVYIPLSAWLVMRLSWRAALGVLTGSAVALFIIGALLIRTMPNRGATRGSLLPEVGAVIATGAARRFLTSQALAGIAASVILAYQVTTMTAAGLSLAAASFWAGARGFAQLGGRIPLMAVVDRIGVARSMQVAYLAIATGTLALAYAGTSLLAAVYAVAAGFGIGALSPLVGMHSRELFGDASLGTSMGAVSLVFFGAGSIGPPLAGLVSTITGSRTVAIVGASILALIAGLLLGRPARPSRLQAAQ